MEFLNLSSVELLPNAKASAAFTVDSSKVFKEQQDIPPVVIDEGLPIYSVGCSQSNAL